MSRAGLGSNCPNCGAPITGARCEYCGTVFYGTVSESSDTWVPTFSSVKSITFTDMGATRDVNGHVIRPKRNSDSIIYYAYYDEEGYIHSPISTNF